MTNLYGLTVYVDTAAVSRTWVFPKDRFIEYGPEDEWWAREYGFGHEETTPAAYQVGKKLIIHPVLWEQLLKETKERMAQASMERVDRLSRDLWSCFSVPKTPFLMTGPF